MAKQKKPGLTQRGQRKLRDPDGLVHVVWMRPRRVVVSYPLVRRFLTITKVLPGSTTVCGLRAYRLDGACLDANTAATCVACVVAT
mgnify:CR=1 FL=1